MKCAQARALLGEYLESDLDLPARAQIDEHLVQCAACKCELQELRSTVALLRSLPTPEPPESLISGVMERIDAGETRIARLPIGFRRVFDPRIAAPLAAGIAGLVLFATMNTGLGTPAKHGTPGSGAEIAGSAQDLATEVLAIATSDQIERRLWDDTPVTLPARAFAANQPSATRSAHFRVQPRLASMERNLTIRLNRPKRQTRVGFYGRTDPDPQYLDLDAHIDRVKVQPEAFLSVVSNTDAIDRRTFIAPFAVRAARRGDAQAVAVRLRRTSHPQARLAADQFDESWRRLSQMRSVQPRSYSR